FGISIERDLLTVEGISRNPLDVYRKVQPKKMVDVKIDGLEEWGED
ncbi:MAG TPA: hypothetical protein HPP90_09755, partial [Deltaproteobacteria bacterium]|nr:hypothetical protein [Deltaproteobacteria bacterium]